MTDLFPLYGVTIGETSFFDIKDNFEVIDEKSTFKSVYVNEVCFLEVEEDGCIGYAFCGEGDCVNIPQKWQETLGVKWGLSIEECKSTLVEKGYKIAYYKEGRRSIFGNYKAQLNVISSNGEYHIQLDFKKDKLFFLIVSMNSCPECKSQDIETVNGEGLNNKFICNECGHRWGLGYLRMI